MTTSEQVRADHACEACGGIGMRYDESRNHPDCRTCLGSGRISDRMPAADALADEQPEQCGICGEYNPEPNDRWPTRTVDLDFGDPEVGPRPDIQDVTVCGNCLRRLDKE